MGSERGPYAKTAGVKRRILEAALASFAENGFAATTIQDVALRADISRRGLVHHFGSKEDLLRGVLQLHEAEHELSFPALGDPLGVRSVLTDTFRNDRVILELHTVLAAEATSDEHPAHDHYRRRYADLRDYLTRAFASAAREGRLASRTDPATLATTLIAILDGSQQQWLYSPDAVDLRAVASAYLDEIGFDEATVASSGDTPEGSA